MGVCWQFVPELDQDCFVEKTRPAQVRTAEYHVRDAKGVCWARHQTQKLWRGEEYTMQIDSHMRFEPGWDETLIGMLKACASQRPVLTTYPMGFTPPRELNKREFVPKPIAREFNQHRILIFGSTSVVVADAPPKPMLHAFLAGGFVFGPSSMISDVPYDPYQYFTGEEVSMAVRLWTHGYDLYAPNRPVLYHNYERQSSARHWSDDKQWVVLSNRSFVRIRHLFGTERTADAEALREIDRYGFGQARSLREYERFTGISFANRTVSERATTYYFPFANREEAEAAARAGVRDIPSAARDADDGAARVAPPARVRVTLSTTFKGPGVPEQLVEGRGGQVER
ncbi:MAG TPA: GlcNAc-transferase family protein, partial [Burkholderiales bacterium]|nr:GlcNAc-transferase family protein [Burkholderiales bacterium]